MAANEIEGSFVGHAACVFEDCGSSDGMAVYKKVDEDGVEFSDGWCYSCERYVSPRRLGEDYDIVTGSDEEEDLDMSDLDDILELPIHGWKGRKLEKRVNEKYGVRTEVDPERGKIAARLYPVTKKGELVGFKGRKLPKEFFKAAGRTKADSDMFGQSVFEPGGKYLAITTGEEDALALAQTLRNVKGDNEYWTPVISPTSGDGSIIKQMKANFEYINSFEKVILMFDQDESGQKHVEEAAKLLAPGKAHIAKIPKKDASDMVKHGLVSELRQAFYKAERFSPVGIVSLGELWDEFENAGTEDIIELPPAFAECNDMLGGGIAHGEVTTIGALTSIGKSTFLNNIAYHAAYNQSKKVGLLYLESSPKELVQSFLSIHKKDNLAIKPRKELNMKQLRYEFKQMVGEDTNIIAINHHGSFTSMDEMFDKIRWLIKAAGCDMVMIDPLQAAVPSNENAMIDEFMDNLLKLAKETNAAIVVVSHMKKPEDDNPHKVSEYSLKGSSSINQISFNTILLSRDKTNSDPNIKNSTKITLVKCRRTGETGDAGWIRYHNPTAGIFASGDPYEDSGELDPNMPDEVESEFLDAGPINSFGGEEKAPWEA